MYTELSAYILRALHTLAHASRTRHKPARGDSALLHTPSSQRACPALPLSAAKFCKASCSVVPAQRAIVSHADLLYLV